MKVIYAPEVDLYLKDLILALYLNDYFGFREDAILDVNRLIDEIENSIDIKKKRASPKYFSRFGKNLLYITINITKNTTWYVFFHLDNDIYYIRHIGNNHIYGKYFI